MWLRLAALWGCTVAEAQARCDPREFDQWHAFWRIEPWGGRAEDLRAGQVAAAVINASGRCEKTATPADFFSSLKPPRPRHVAWRNMQSAVRELVEMRRRSKNHGK